MKYLSNANDVKLCNNVKLATFKVTRLQNNPIG
jgi:hypothetical protein